MASENAKIDSNSRHTLIGVTDDASAEIRRLLVDPTTGRLLVSADFSGDIGPIDSLIFQETGGGTDTITMKAPASIAASYTLTLPTTDGTPDQVLTTDGSGVLSWTSNGSGDVSGPGSSTDNAVTRFDSTTGKVLQNSTVIISDTGTITGVEAITGIAGGSIITGGTGSGDDLTLRSTANATKGDIFMADLGGNVIIGGAATASRLRILEASGSGTNYTEFVVQPQAANITYTLPPDDGDAGEFLKTDGSGSLIWDSPAGGGDVTGPGSATDNAIVRFDGSGGKTIQNSGVIIDDTDNVTGMATLTLTNAGLHLLDTNASHDLIITPGSDLTADRVLTLTTGDAARTVTLSADLTVAATASVSGTLVASSGKTFTSIKTLSLDGTDGTTMTFPTTSATIARTDAANAFTGASTASAWVLTAPTITTSIVPTSDDGAALGSTSKQFSDVFLAEGGVINWDNGDATMTQTGNDITVAGITSFGVGTSTAVTLGTIELGAASDTTIARVSAGLISVEGITVVDVSTVQTLTNKTLTSPTLTTPSAFTTGGSITLAENSTIALDPAGSADGKFTGITITATSGYTQAFGDLVYLDPTDSRWEAVDANSAAGADGDARGLLGMVVVTGTDGNACTILLNGIIRADAKFPTFTVNNPIYCSETAAAVTQTQPTTTDVVIRIVGAALTADEMYFNPDNTWVTHT